MNRINRNLVIALAISAALNIFFAGFTAARLAFPGPRGPGRAAPASDKRHRPFSGEIVGAAGPMKRFFREHAEQLAPQRKALRRARKSVALSLQAEEFQPDSLRSALSELRQVTAESQRVLHEAVVEMATKSTLEQRRALSRSRFLRHPRGRHRR